MLILLTSSCKCISVFLLECSDFWGSKIFKWMLRRWGGGGGGGRRGSDLNVQLTLSGEEVNMLMAPY